MSWREDTGTDVQRRTFLAGGFRCGYDVVVVAFNAHQIFRQPPVPSITSPASGTDIAGMGGRLFPSFARAAMECEAQYIAAQLTRTFKRLVVPCRG
jgi:hypothetical protein